MILADCKVLIYNIATHSFNFMVLWQTLIVGVVNVSHISSPKIEMITNSVSLLWIMTN